MVIRKIPVKKVRGLFHAIAAIAVLSSCAPPPSEPLPPTTSGFEAPAGVVARPIDEIPRDARGRIKRSRAVLAEFQRQVPCPNLEARAKPSTHGGTRGACPGFEIDHIVPLCAGGPDAVVNLQWLWSVEHDDVKTPRDVALCRSLRSAAKANAVRR